MPRVTFEVTLTIEVDPEDFGVEWDLGDEKVKLQELAEKVREEIEEALRDMEPDIDKVEVEDVEYEEGEIPDEEDDEEPWEEEEEDEEEGEEEEEDEEYWEEEEE